MSTKETGMTASQLDLSHGNSEVFNQQHPLWVPQMQRASVDHNNSKHDMQVFLVDRHEAKHLSTY